MRLWSVSFDDARVYQEAWANQYIREAGSPIFGWAREHVLAILHEHAAQHPLANMRPGATSASSGVSMPAGAATPTRVDGKTLEEDLGDIIDDVVKETEGAGDA